MCVYDNHSIAYCLLSYLCAYYRYHYPFEFITAYLNNAANDNDSKMGADMAKRCRISLTSPRWSFSRSSYFYDKEKRVIAKGLSAVKYMSAALADELYALSKERVYGSFMDLLLDLDTKTSADSRQLDILIRLDFFSEFGNQRELLRMVDLFAMFKKGEAKQIKKSEVDGTPLEEIVKRYAVGVTKSGGIAKSYTLLDVMAVLRDAESSVKASGLEDLSVLSKMAAFNDAMGYAGYVSGKEEDRRKLFVTDIRPVCRKSDGRRFGYGIFTHSIGSGVESRFTVFCKVYDVDPIQKGDVILCKRFERDGSYFRLVAYEKLH